MVVILNSTALYREMFMLLSIASFYINGMYKINTTNCNFQNDE